MIIKNILKNNFKYILKSSLIFLPLLLTNCSTCNCQKDTNAYIHKKTYKDGNPFFFNENNCSSYITYTKKDDTTTYYFYADEEYLSYFHIQIGSTDNYIEAYKDYETSCSLVVKNEYVYTSFDDKEYNLSKCNVYIIYRMYCGLNNDYCLMNCSKRIYLEGQEDE